MALLLEAKMGEVIKFIPRVERERIRLIKEARSIYEGVFPQSDPGSETLVHSVNGTWIHSDGEPLP